MDRKKVRDIFQYTRATFIRKMVVGTVKVPELRDFYEIYGFLRERNLTCHTFFLESSHRRELCVLVSISCLLGLPGEVDLIWTLMGTRVHQYVFTASNSISERGFMILYLTEWLAQHLFINASVSENSKLRDLEKSLFSEPQFLYL